MSEGQYEKLVGLWRAGQIDDKALKRELALLHSTSPLNEAEYGRSRHQIDGYSSGGYWIRLPAKLLLPSSCLASLSPFGRRFVEIGTFALVALIIGAAVVWALFGLLIMGIEKNVYSAGTVLWMMMLLIVGSLSLAYEQRGMVMVTMLMLVAVFLSPLFLDDHSRPSYPSTSTSASVSRTALEKMEIAFDGGYSQDQIEPLLNVVMRYFGSPLTEIERERAGSALVALRKDSGAQEMEILGCMQAMGPQPIKFSDAAAICATTLSTK